MLQIDRDRLLEIITLQDKFNQRLDKDWRKQNWDWESCITVEVGEALDSLQYKHWKKQELDIENAKIEAIDVLHFHLSSDLQSCATITIHKHLKRHFRSIVDSCQSVTNLRQAFNDYNLYRSTKNLANIFVSLGMSIEDIHKKYIIKNVLNTFRAKNGYKEGTYIKVWDGVEDNKVAMSMWEENSTYTSLYLSLIHKYKALNKG